MKINNQVKFLQEGGPMGAPAMEGAPVEQNAAPAGGGEDPIMMIAQMAAQALQNNDGEMALQVCQAFLELVQQMSGEGGGAPAQPQGEPVYRKGGKIAYRINK